MKNDIKVYIKKYLRYQKYKYITYTKYSKIQ